MLKASYSLTHPVNAIEPHATNLAREFLVCGVVLVHVGP